MIQQIMEESDAIRIYNEMSEKLGIVDLKRICKIKPKPKDDDSVAQSPDVDEMRYNTMIRAIACGLVYWDDEKNCIVQKLAPIVQDGDIKREFIYYKNKYSMKQAKKSKTTGLGAHVEMLGFCCELPTCIIDGLAGMNLEVSLACMDFFSK